MSEDSFTAIAIWTASPGKFQAATTSEGIIFFLHLIFFQDFICAIEHN